jgi:hypothetical protein
MAAYVANQDAAIHLAIEASVVGEAILRLVEEEYVWSGTARLLLQALVREPRNADAMRRRGWPSTPNGMSAALHRLASSLRRMGVKVESWRQGKKRERMIRLSRQATEAPLGHGNVTRASVDETGSDAFQPQDPFGATTADVADAKDEEFATCTIGAGEGFGEL